MLSLYDLMPNIYREIRSINVLIFDVCPSVNVVILPAPYLIILINKLVVIIIFVLRGATFSMLVIVLSLCVTFDIIVFRFLVLSKVLVYIIPSIFIKSDCSIMYVDAVNCILSVNCLLIGLHMISILLLSALILGLF